MEQKQGSSWVMVAIGLDTNATLCGATVTDVCDQSVSLRLICDKN